MQRSPILLQRSHVGFLSLLNVFIFEQGISDSLQLRHALGEKKFRNIRPLFLTYLYNMEYIIQ